MEDPQENGDKRHEEAMARQMKNIYAEGMQMRGLSVR